MSEPYKALKYRSIQYDSIYSIIIVVIEFMKSLLSYGNVTIKTKDQLYFKLSPLIYYILKKFYT
jgi:hypothetical protein